MLYRNTKTGAVIDVNSEMGGKWEPVSAPKAVPEKKAEKPAPAKRKGAVKK